MSDPSSSAPSRSWPAEWQPHSATLLSWPHRRRDWPCKFPVIPWLYAEIVRLVAECEPVLLLVPPGRDGEVEKALRMAMVPFDRVTLLPLKTDRSWVRDSGPTVVRRETGALELINWFFNGWAKYPDWRNDAEIPTALAEHLKLPISIPRAEGKRVVLEGGAIDGDGEGTILTTEECLLARDQQRNWFIDRGQYENLFRDYLGTRKVIWLDRGIVGDDTHGHVDDLARFVAPATVVLAETDDESDPNHARLRGNRERLESETDAAGRKLTVVPLPMPRPVLFRGQQLPASYANFYILNGRVLVPTFHDRRDRQALGVLAELMPDREVIGVHAVDLVWGLGTLHCLSQQIPEM